MLKALATRAAQSLRKSWKQHLATLALAWVAIVAVDTWRTRDLPQGPAPDVALVMAPSAGATAPTTLAQWRAQGPRPDLWVFAYASLVWRPEFEAAEQRPARVRGYSMPTAFMSSKPGAGINHKVYRASHFIQEDLGEELAADMVSFISAFPLAV